MVKRYKILLIEDEPDVCSAIESYLGRRGYLVSSTPSGTEGLIQIDVQKPDLILLDFTLEDIHGREVLKTLRLHDRTTKVVVITGELLSATQEAQVHELGVSALVQKPILLEELDKIVRRVIEESTVFNPILERIHPRAAASAPHDSSIHKLANLFNIIRTKAEAFTLDLKDGVFAGKTDKQIIDEAGKIMTGIIKAVDEATAVLKKFEKN